MVGRIIVATLVAWGLAVSPCLMAGPQEGWREHYRPEDFKLFEPSRFFADFESDYFPEMKGINPDQWPELGRLMNFLQNQGIPIGIGTNSNNHTIFELYLPLVSRPDGMIGPTIGVTRDSRVGNLYFLAHDAVHHYVGIPGPRMKDLQDRDRSIQKLVDIMLTKEQVATTHSMSEYIRRFWNWRDAHRHGFVNEDFVRLNQGLLSMGPMDRSTYVDVIGDFVFGRSVTYGRKLWNHVSPSRVRDARRAGVPLGGATFYPFTGLTLESYIYRLLIPVVEPILARYREVGYEGFMAYSQAMAEFMLQPWYVEWAERFDFGIPLDQLRERAQRHLEDLRAGRLLGDEKAVDSIEFERRVLLNEIALLGRRIAEAKEMGRRRAFSDVYRSADTDRLSHSFQSMVALSEMLKREAAVSSRVLQDYRDVFNETISDLENKFRIEDILLPEYRHPFLNYSRYWREMTGVLVPRYGHNSSALSVVDAKKFVRARRESRQNLSKRARWAVFEELQKTQFGRLEYFWLQSALADDYEAEQSRQPIFTNLNQDRDVMTNDIHKRYVFLGQLETLRTSIEFQVKSVIKPQIIESFSLTGARRTPVMAILDEFVWQMTHGVDALADAYKAVYVREDSVRELSAELNHREARLNAYLDMAYRHLFEFVEALQSSHKAEALEDIIAKLGTLNAEFAAVSQSVPVSLASNLQSIFPHKTHRWWMIGDLMRRLWASPRSSLYSDLKAAALSYRILRRSPQQSFRLEKSREAKSLLPEDGVLVLNLNHEQALLEVALAERVFKDAGIERTFVLTTRKAWGLVPKARVSDADTVYIEDDKPLDLLVQKVAAAKAKRIGILLCPEGRLPSLAASMPLTAKPGAFVLARKLAVALKDRLAVFAVNGIFNGLEHFTADVAPPLVLKLYAPERVPTNPLSPRDSWVAHARLEFENLVNKTRAQRLADLVHPRKSSQTNLAVTAPVRRFLPFGEWFQGSTFPKCAAIVRQLHGLPHL